MILQAKVMELQNSLHISKTQDVKLLSFFFQLHYCFLYTTVIIGLICCSYWSRESYWYLRQMHSRVFQLLGDASSLMFQSNVGEVSWIPHVLWDSYCYFTFIHIHWITDVFSCSVAELMLWCGEQEASVWIAASSWTAMDVIRWQLSIDEEDATTMKKLKAVFLPLMR